MTVDILALDQLPSELEKLNSCATNMHEARVTYTYDSEANCGLKGTREECVEAREYTAK